MNKIAKNFLTKLYYIELEVSILTLSLSTLFLLCGIVSGVTMSGVLSINDIVHVIVVNIFIVFSNYFFVFPIYFVVLICNVININSCKKLSIYKKFTYSIITIPIVLNGCIALFLGLKFSALNLFFALFILFCCVFKWYAWLLVKISNLKIKYNKSMVYILICTLFLFSNLIISIYIYIFISVGPKNIIIIGFFMELIK